MNKRIYPSVALFIITLALLFAGCKKDDPLIDDPVIVDGTTKTEASATTQKVNKFIYEVMGDVYLWYNQLPQIEQKYETDSKVYFKKLLYKDDKWSYITDNIAEWENSLQGIEKSFGYSLAFGRFVDAGGATTGNLFAIVEYVHPNTPAKKAGFDRGSLITQINGGNITTANYRQLLSDETITVTKGVLTTSGISVSGTVSMTAEELNLDPVMIYKIIEKDGHKIGYLFYTQFIANYNNSLQTALEFFRTNLITDLVLDLRYNPGGHTTAAQYLCSAIAPLTAVDGPKTLVTYQWNDKYQDYWMTKNITEQTTVPFLNTVPVKLGLNKVTILTGPGTASAAELTITGLKPYMNVVMVGDTTFGKYTASITLKPEDFYTDASSYADFKNWGIQPIVLRYANSLGITNFVNGFAPDHLIADELLPAQPLGDLSETLLKKAVETITGVPVVALKSAATKYEFKVFDRGFSLLDPVKRNAPVDVDIDFIRKRLPVH